VVTIRKFRVGDLPRVLQIERVSFGPDAYSASTFMAHVFRDRKGLFVAEEASEIVGYTLVRVGLGWIGAKKGGLTSIAVDPGHRRKGIGRALLAHALEYLREHKVDEADLEVNVTNLTAQSLYESFGFRRSRLLPDYYGEKRDGIRMVLDMRSASAELGEHQHGDGDASPKLQQKIDE
jgi:ribosomal-protein-alanine acetyltransferase